MSSQDMCGNPRMPESSSFGKAGLVGGEGGGSNPVPVKPGQDQGNIAGCEPGSLGAFPALVLGLVPLKKTPFSFFFLPSHDQKLE